VLGICHLFAPAPGSGLSNSWLRLRAPGFKNLGSGTGLRPFKILAPAPAPAPEPAIFGAAPCWLRAPGGKSMNYFSLGRASMFKLNSNDYPAATPPNT